MYQISCYRPETSNAELADYSSTCVLEILEADMVIVYVNAGVLGGDPSSAGTTTFETAFVLGDQVRRYRGCFLESPEVLLGA